VERKRKVSTERSDVETRREQEMERQEIEELKARVACAAVARPSNTGAAKPRSSSSFIKREAGSIRCRMRRATSSP
jgi:hypothetical protein